MRVAAGPSQTKRVALFDRVTQRHSQQGIQTAGGLRTARQQWKPLRNCNSQRQWRNHRRSFAMWTLSVAATPSAVCCRDVTHRRFPFILLCR